MIDDYKRREAMYEHLNVAYNHYKKVKKYIIYSLIRATVGN
jgi:chlorite dismutase